MAIEVPSPGNESLIRISSFEELKDKIDPRVNIDELKEMFDFNKDWVIETSTNELAQLREQFIKTWNLEAIKWFLERAKQSIVETTQKWVEGIKRDLSKYSKIEAQKQKAWKEDWVEASETLASSLEWLSSIATEAWIPKVAQKAKEIASATKDKIEWAGVIDWMIEKAKWLGWWIGEFLAWVLSFFKWLIWLWDKAEKPKEVAEKALSPEEAEKTKEKLTIVWDTFIEQFNTKIDSNSKILPENKKALQKLIKNPGFFSEAELSLISEKIEKWEFKLSDLQNILWKSKWWINKYKLITETIFNPAQIELLKNNFSNIAIKTIENEYSIDFNKLTKEKKEKLRELIINNWVEDDLIQVAEKYESWKFISIAELLKTWLLWAVNSLTFSIKLIEIIPFSNLANHIARSATDLLELAIGNETWKNIILKNLEWLWDEEKNIIFWILLRKWMFIYNLMEWLSFSITRTITESIIGWNKWNAFSNIKAVATNDFLKQSEMFKWTLNALWQPNSNLWKWLKERIDILTTASKEARKIAILMEWVKNWTVKGETKETIWKRINKMTANLEIENKWIWSNLSENKVGFSKQSSLYKLIQKQESGLKILTNEWNRYLDNWKLWKLRLSDKAAAIWESIRFTQNNRNIEIHAENLQDWANKLKKLHAFSNEFPKLASSLIWVAWISIVVKSIWNKDKNKDFLENVLPLVQYIVPTWWPIKVLFIDSWIQRADTFRNSIKMSAETWVMWMFLAMDAAYISKEVLYWINSWQKIQAMKNIAWYHLKIFKTPLDLAISIKNMSVIWYEWLKAPWKIDIKKSSRKIIKNIIEKIKELKPKNRFSLIVAAFIASGITVSMLIESSEEKWLEDFKEQWYIKDWDWNYEKIWNESTNEEREIILTYFIWGKIKWLEIKIKWDKLNIISRNENLQYKSSLISNYLDILQKIWIDTTNEESIKFSYEKA